MKLCPACALAFHTIFGVEDFDNASGDCDCRHPNCGCKTKREAK